MAEQLFEIQTDKIVNGSKLMYDNTALLSWVGDLSSMVNGQQMFECCYNLTSFTGDLSSLTDGASMFATCTHLTSFTSDLSSLTQGGSMFNLCSLDAPSVKNIALTINKNVTNNPSLDIGINSSITSDAQVKKDIGLIKHKGWNVYTNNSNGATTYTLPKYAGCTNHEEIVAKDANYKTNDIVNGAWTEHLPDLTSGIGEVDGMFQYNSTLESFTADLSSLTIGVYMFNSCTNLTTFTSNLSSLTNGIHMFHSCIALTSFSSDLPSLTNGRYMFNNTKLTSFTSDLSSLTYGANMFEDCTNLTTFDSDLSSLTEGENMFSGCTNLWSFSADLSSLEDGTGMFYGCVLDADSMENIANTLPNTTNGCIDIRYYQPPTEDLYNRINNAITTIRNKGWTNGEISGFYDSGGTS